MEKRIYLILTGVGMVLPYSQFLLFLLENGLNYSLNIDEITVYRLSSFAWFDVIVTSIVMILVILEQKDKLSRWGLPVIVTILVGPSCGLSFYCFLENNCEIFYPSSASYNQILGELCHD